MSVSMEEQETTVTSSRGDDVVRIWTANPYHRVRLDKEPRARKVREDAESAWYEVNRSDWNPLGGFKRRVSEEQRAAMSARMKAAR